MQTTLLAHLVHAARSLFEVQEPDVWELAMALAVRYPQMYRDTMGEHALIACQRRPARSLPAVLITGAARQHGDANSILDALATSLVLAVSDDDVPPGQGTPCTRSRSLRSAAVLAAVRALHGLDDEPAHDDALSQSEVASGLHARMLKEIYDPGPMDPFEQVQDGTEEEAEALPVPDADALREMLRTRVDGQDVAVDRVIDELLLGLNGARLRPARPRAVMLFAGPSGVGKTEMAKAIAGVVSGDQESLIRLDMSEYEHPSTITRLTGPPPGYRGSTEPAGWLTQRIIDCPRSVLLLDEIEKAHPSVLTVFLQVFDEGRLTDGMGRTVDFSETIICLTSNLGTRAAFTPTTGFSTGDPMQARAAQRDQDIARAVRTALPPELIGRLDAVIPFAVLDAPTIVRIAQRSLARATSLLDAQGRSVYWDEDVVGEIPRRAQGSEYGVREMQSIIERDLLVPILKRSPGEVAVAAVGGDFLILDGVRSGRASEED